MDRRSRNAGMVAQTRDDAPWRCRGRAVLYAEAGHRPAALPARLARGNGSRTSALGGGGQARSAAQECARRNVAAGCHATRDAIRASQGRTQTVFNQARGNQRRARATTTRRQLTGGCLRQSRADATETFRGGVWVSERGERSSGDVPIKVSRERAAWAVGAGVGGRCSTERERPGGARRRDGAPASCLAPPVGPSLQARDSRNAAVPPPTCVCVSVGGARVVRSFNGPSPDVGRTASSLCQPSQTTRSLVPVGELWKKTGTNPE